MNDARVSGSGLKRLGVYVAWFLAVVGFATAIFEFEMPPIGYIDIEFAGMSESSVFWQIENRSSHPIYMQGTGEKVWGGSSAITKCTNFEHWESDPSSLADGAPSTIRVAPGGRFRLTVDTTLPAKFKGGLCHIVLSLLGGTFVESRAFTPK